MFHFLSRVRREWGGRVSTEHTAHRQVSMGRKWCHAPCAPWNVLDTILLSTQNTTLAQGAPGFDWYLVQFDGAWIKGANKFCVHRGYRPQRQASAFIVWNKLRDTFQAFLSAAPGRTAFRKMVTRFGFYNELPNLDGHISFCEWREIHSWDFTLPKKKIQLKLPHTDNRLCFSSLLF